VLSRVRRAGRRQGERSNRHRSRYATARPGTRRLARMPAPGRPPSPPRPVAARADEGAWLGARRVVRFAGREEAGGLSPPVTERTAARTRPTALPYAGPVTSRIALGAITREVRPREDGAEVPATWSMATCPSWPGFRPGDGRRRLPRRLRARERHGGASGGGPAGSGPAPGASRTSQPRTWRGSGVSPPVSCGAHPSASRPLPDRRTRSRPCAAIIASPGCATSRSRSRSATPPAVDDDRADAQHAGARHPAHDGVAQDAGPDEVHAGQWR
jgi:hypothetical protein